MRPKPQVQAAEGVAAFPARLANERQVKLVQGQPEKSYGRATIPYEALPQPPAPYAQSFPLVFLTCCDGRLFWPENGASVPSEQQRSRDDDDGRSASGT